MQKEAKRTRSDQEHARINEAIFSKALPIINRVFDNPIFDNVDHSKLITKLVVMDGSLEDLKEKKRIESPIRKIFPYYNELIELGVKPNLVENVFYNISEDTPYDRDILKNPSQFDIPKDFPSLFSNPMLGMTAIITALDVLSLPNPKKIKKPEIRSIAREALRKYTIETSLKKMIKESRQDFEDPKFDHVKMTINRDLDAEQTRFFFFGGQISGALSGQTLDACAFSTRTDVHQAVAHSLSAPIMKAILAKMVTNPMEANLIMQQYRQGNKEAVPLIKKAVGLDLSLTASLTEKDEKLDDYKLLLDLYLNSQIPLIAMDCFI